MANKFPDVTCFIDAAGRFSHNKDTPLIFAAVGMWTSEVDSIRESLIASTGSRLEKWSDLREDAKTSKAIFRLIAKRQLYGAVNIVWKTSPHWELYHQVGQELYEKGVKKAQESIPYAKSMSTLKLHLFGDAMADLYGHMIGRNRHFLSKNRLPLQPVTVSAIFDSDIHGQANQKVFKTVMASANDLPKTEESTVLRTEFQISIGTEQEEPLLFLPDHLAGFYYSSRAYGESSDNDRSEILKAIAPVISKWSPDCCRLREGPFREEYLLEQDVFDHVLPKKQRDELLLALATESPSVRQPLHGTKWAQDLEVVEGTKSS